MPEGLRFACASTLKDKLARITAAADLVIAANSREFVPEALIDLMAQTHKLAGSAGTFGFSDVGDAASKLELYCQPLIANNAPPSKRECQEIEDLVEFLQQFRDQFADSEQTDTSPKPKKIQSGDKEFTDDPTILLIKDDIQHEPWEEHVDASVPISIPKQPGTARPLKDAIVIDDDPMICAFVKQFAESAGFRVVSFTDPLKFTDFYSAKTDLILLDLNMPIMDGIEVLRFLGDNRSKAAWSDPKIVVQVY